MDQGNSKIRALPPIAAALLATACLSAPVFPPECECTPVASEQTTSEASQIAAVHEVRPGDTLSWIARNYGVSVESVASRNDIADVDRLSVGERVRLPVGARLLHFVHNQDTLSSIAANHGVPVSTIVAENALEGDTLIAGQVLHLPPEAKLPPAPLTGLESAPSVRRDRPAHGSAAEGSKRDEMRLWRERRLTGADALLALAEEDYLEARFEGARTRARDARALLSDPDSGRELRARAAFVEGSALAGLGRDEEALKAFDRTRSIDPTFVPPAAWLSPKIRALYPSPSER